MKTNKLFSSLLLLGTRFTILTAMLMGMVANVPSAAAAPEFTLTALLVGAQQGTLTTGTGGSVTYLVTVTKNNSNNNTNATLSISWTGGIPTGVTTSFSPQVVSWGNSGGDRTSTLTITTTAATPAAARNFTVRVQRNGGDFQTATGTLTIAKADQTITFGPLSDKTEGDPDFNVSATASSGLAVSFSALGSCTVSGTLVHLTSFGSCTITASQAGNTNYNAAPSVQQSFTINPAGPVTSLDLYAMKGTTSLPNGASVPVWGYSDTSSGPLTQPGGPVLDVNQGDVVSVTLHNVDIPENTALLFLGQSMIPDLTGIGAGGSKTYTFVASQAGTFLYEAGLIESSHHQVAMGMYGALIVRPATAGQAYSGASTAFDEEAVLVLSEIDPSLNNSASPAAFDMRSYHPRYWLINGKSYPQTAPISTAAGHKVLLRYVNAGIQVHSMSVLGVRQSMIAIDGNPFNHAHSMVAESIGPGRSMDTIVTVPASAGDGSKFAIYEASFLQHNNNAAGFGGMLTFLNVSGTPTTGDTTGPATSGVNLTATSVSATISDAGRGDSNVTAAEFFIDTTGANGTGTAMTGAFASATESVSGVITPALSGTHTVYVHGQDSAGNWGPFQSAVISNDTTGPATSALVLSPASSNGTGNVSLSGTADDTSTGGSNIAAAEYTIDGGAATAMSVSPSGAKVASLSATIPAATVNALAEGAHSIAVRSQDSLGNWGATALTSLVVDKTGPTTSSVIANPNPNNGTLGFNSSTPAVRVTASFADGLTNISAAEGFIDSVGANGTGFLLIATDGIFNSSSENGYVDIPLTTIGALSAGNHTIYVHGKDAAGNWGATSTTVLVIDKTAPTIVSITRMNANPTSAASVNWLVTFSESVTGVSAANFSLVQGGGLTGAAITSVTGSGATRTVTASTGSSSGTLGLNLASAAGITDIAGNALSGSMPVVGPAYTLLTPPLYFSTFGTTNPPGVGGTADDADIYFWDGAAFSRVLDASIAPYLLPSGANVDGFDRVDATHFYMSFNGSVTVPGIGVTVQDEDVVYYNAGAWSMFFDGSLYGLGGTTGSTSFDLDAISIVGGTLYFSTDNTNIPAGAGGSGDDADIYRWNGGSSYTRMYDASAIGWSTANVDGFVFVDATHYYLSYSADTTITGLGAFEDEDVVYYNNGTWSVYFDGTAKGLTSGNLDVDAFDLP